MKFHIGWLLPEVCTSNTPGCRILDIRLPNTFAFEYLKYDEGSTWYLVVQVLGFGFCANVTVVKQ
jgi:hypothetical protein